MSATDELRRMLDERSVKWDYGITGSTTTRFDVNGTSLTFTPMRWGLMCSSVLTPVQVIEITLGRGECRAVSMRERDKRPYLNDEQVCSECGCQLAHEFGDVWQNYCPNCGRKVRR